MKAARIARRLADKTLDAAIVVAVAVLVLDVLWGVFTRYVMGSPSQWTEEVAQYLLMWVALLGAAAAFLGHEHLGFDYVVGKMHPSTQRLAGLVSHGVVFVFAALVMVLGGYTLVTETLASQQVTPALGMQKGHIYIALPLCGLFVLLYQAEALCELAAGDSTTGSGDAGTDPGEA